MADSEDDPGSSGGNKKQKPVKPVRGFQLPDSLRRLFDGEGPQQDPPPPKDWPEIDPAGSELPAGSPVTALGIQGRIFFYLNAAGQLVQLGDHEHGRHALLALFGGDVAYLEKIWPKLGPPNAQGVHKILGVRYDLVEQCLMLECNRRGPWDPLYRMRGPGAWSDERGRLIMHYGDEVQIEGEAFPPGEIDGHIYESGARWPHPAAELASGGPQGAGALVLGLLQSWRWRRACDPYLELGHIAASKIGGALSWRPTVWIIGPPGSGKTTLEQHLLAHLYGRNGVIRLTDSSEAGVRQIARYASLPVIVDELEPGNGRQRVQQVVTLARYAASGGITARGSAGHVAYQFVVRSCYCFSSVYAAPLIAQDRSRISVLELLPLDGAAELPDLGATRIGILGRLLTRRLVEQWPRFPDVFECFRRALRQSGHNARSCDQYGTLAACMFLALHDGEPGETVLPDREREPEAYAEECQMLRPDDLAFWVHCFPAVQLVEENDDTPDAQRCLDYLLGSLVDPRRAGERRTVGQVLEQDISRVVTSGPVASELLDTVGLKLIAERVDLASLSADDRELIIEGDDRVLVGAVVELKLAVANAHRGLLDLFAGSPWAGVPGAGGAGWVQALRRLPGAVPGKAMRFGGIKSRVTLLSLKSQFGLRCV
jgi:hypothetical protein